MVSVRDLDPNLFSGLPLVPDSVANLYSVPKLSSWKWILIQPLAMEYVDGFTSVVEPKLFVSAPAPTFTKFRSRLRLRH